MRSKLDSIRKYFSLLERFSTDRSDYAEVLHPEFRQLEFPNTLNRTGQESDLSSSMERAVKGSKMLSQQSYKIANSVEGPEQIVVEALWKGRMALDAGPLKAGQDLSAHFCIVCEFRDGKIYRQRNYDCFDPFG